MPKTTLIETEVVLDRGYLKTKGDEYDPKEFIQPGMTFTMKYTHTKNYESRDGATVQVTVESVRSVIEDYYDIDDEDYDTPSLYHLGCVLKTETPIFICITRADLGRPFTLYKDSIQIADGTVGKILEHLLPSRYV